MTNLLTGTCLCKKIKFKIKNPGHVIFCHCRDCLKYHGHVAAYTRIRSKDISLQGKKHLQWYTPSTSYKSTNEIKKTTGARRGFCRLCGSNLFWQIQKDMLSVSAGSLDPPTHLQGKENIYISERSDYYQLEDLTNYRRSSTLPSLTYSEMGAVGKNMFFELSEFKTLRYFNLSKIQKNLRKIANTIKANVVHEHFHEFSHDLSDDLSTKGLTGFLLLAESHLVIHTWPEKKWIALEIFMCRDYDEEVILTLIKKSFQPGKIHWHKKLIGKSNFV